MKRLVNGVLRKIGQEIRPVRAGNQPEGIEDLDASEKEILQKAQPYTMTSVERIIASMNAAKHAVKAKVPGAIVECGVWRGGNMMAMAMTLAACGDVSRPLFLYDTFEGMSEPTGVDVDLGGASASKTFVEMQKDNEDWCKAGLEEVKAALVSTEYPESRMRFVKGRVENTIPATIPESISVLRLDTDWYESTRHELEHLYPKLSRGGVLIIDDYGHWQGARRAADEYLEKFAPGCFLHRIDYTGRLLIKP